MAEATDKTLTLFDVPEAEARPPAKKLSADRRRTLRQSEALARGVHPLTLAGFTLYLHADAAPWNDRQADGRRCGNCAFRLLLGHHDRTYGKCVRDDGIRVTHGAGTDVRRWWPACRDHEWGDPDLSDDAARWVPES